jgi:hypothetical protein
VGTRQAGIDAGCALGGAAVETVWDSGAVASAQSSQVAYAGAPLRPASTAVPLPLQVKKKEKEEQKISLALLQEHR